MAARQHNGAWRSISAADVKNAQHHSPGQRLRIFAIALRHEDSVRIIVQNHVTRGSSSSHNAKQTVANEGQTCRVSPREILGGRGEAKLERCSLGQEIVVVSDFLSD